MSATVVDLLRELDLHHVAVIRDGDKIKLRSQNAPPADLIEKLRSHKVELLALLTRVQHQESTVTTVTPSLSSARPTVNFRLPCTLPGGWATAIGSPGESVESLAGDLRMRWSDVEIAPRVQQRTRAPAPRSAA